ncbi:MAG: hypothetical protein OXG05_12730 [Gammaproteobacteria bacterium]|nr:hypothetical protein [Gammaproteobacteria bacterium]
MAPTVDCGYENASLLSLHGPSILVQIGFDLNYRQGLKPLLPSPGYRALIDTGAVECCIDTSVARSLGLPVVDTGDIAGVHGFGQVQIHLAQIYVPELNYTTSGRFAGVHLHASGQPYGALLGRSLLRDFNLEYNGRTGAVTISSTD